MSKQKDKIIQDMTRLLKKTVGQGSDFSWTLKKDDRAFPAHPRPLPLETLQEIEAYLIKLDQDQKFKAKDFRVPRIFVVNPEDKPELFEDEEGYKLIMETAEDVDGTPDTEVYESWTAANEMREEWLAWNRGDR